MDSYIIVDVRTKLKKSLYRLSWKIVGWQHCFVNFGCGTDNIFFYKSVKFQINIFTSPEASSVSFFGIFLVNICKTFNNRTKWAGSVRELDLVYQRQWGRRGGRKGSIKGAEEG